MDAFQVVVGKGGGELYLQPGIDERVGVPGGGETAHRLDDARGLGALAAALALRIWLVVYDGQRRTKAIPEDEYLPGGDRTDARSDGGFHLFAG